MEIADALSMLSRSKCTYSWGKNRFSTE